MVFDSIASFFAGLLGTTTEIAGFILGFAVIALLTLSIMLLTGSRRDEGSFVLLVSGIGIVFVTVVGWWPIWAPIFLAMIIALIIVKPFGGSSSGGI